MSKSVLDLYKSKLISAEQAAKLVKSGDWVQYGEFVQQPVEIDAALAARKDELEDVKIRLVTMSFLPQVCQVDPKRETFCMNDWHFSGVSRKLHEADLCNYISLTYHEGPEHYFRGYDPVDICFQPVTAMDKNGYFNVSTSNSISTAVWEVAKTKVLYVNTSAPWCCGGNGEIIHISETDYVVESQANPPLPQIPGVPPSDVDKKLPS
jgi:acyl-CoA hydrolase